MTTDSAGAFIGIFTLVAAVACRDASTPAAPALTAGLTGCADGSAIRLERADRERSMVQHRCGGSPHVGRLGRYPRRCSEQSADDPVLRSVPVHAEL